MTNRARLRRLWLAVALALTWDTAGLASRNPTVATTVVDARGETTEYTADRYGSLVSVLDPLLQTTTREWDPRHRRPTRLVDARGVETTWTYDDHGNPTSERVEREGPLGLEVFTTTTTYADPGSFTPPYLKDRVSSRTDRTGQLFELEWDAKGRLLAESTTVDPIEGTPQLVRTTHAYQENGDRRSTTDPRGFTTTFTYDAYGLPRTRRDPRGGERTSVHDPRGRLRELVDEEGRRTQFLWDALDRQVEVIHPDGTAESWEYRDAERQVLASDELERTTTTHFDLEGRMVLVENPAGGRMETAWSPAGDKLLETRSFDGDTPRVETTFGYDELGRVEWRQEPEGRRTTFGYDPVGNVIHETLEDTTPGSTFLTRETERDHDALSRVVAERRRLDGNWVETHRTLDGEGRPILEVDELDRETTRQFDGLGRMLEELRPLGARTRREYDAAGNLLRERISNTHGGQPFDQIRLREYDQLGRLIAETDAEGKVRRLQYDQVGNVVRREDRRGVVTELVWDQRNRLRFERLPLDRFSVPPRGIAETAYTYDAVGNLRTETWPNGNVLTHGYDALDRRTETIDSVGSISRTEYDARGNVTARVDGEGRRTESDYDALDRETERRAPEERTSNWTWDAAGNRLSETNPRRFTTTWRYDQLERVVEEEDAVGEVSRFEYDDAGNRTATIGRRGYRVEQVFDELDRLVRVDDPSEVGSSMSYAYDLVGNNISETDRNGNLTTHAYDRENRLVRTERNGVLVTSLQLDAEGNAQLATDARGYSVAFERDERGEVTRETRELASVVRFTRDVIGNIVEERDPENRVTSREWDARRRLVREINHAGESTSYEHDLVGNLTAVVRPGGAEYRHEYEFDGADRLVGVRDSLANETFYEHDPASNHVATVDAEGRRTERDYDDLDRVSIERLADGATSTFGYDAEGNRTAHTDPRGLLRNFELDALGREVRATYQIPDPPTGEDVIERRTAYDANGNVVRVEEDVDGEAEPRVVTQIFDDFDRLFSRTDQHGRTVGYRYDLAGNVVQLVGPDGRVTRLTYDALDRVSSLEIPGLGTATFTWLRDGRLSRIQFPQGAAELREYDAAGRVHRVTHSQHTALVSQVTYSYDANGNRIAQEEINGGGPEQTLYTFDLADRLTGVAYAEELVEYVLDKVGNRIGEKTFSLGGGGPPTLTSDKTFTLDLRHRVVSIADALDPAGSETYEWDAAGNQTARVRGGVREDFFYDARNRLIEVRRDGLLLERYRYDERDRRVRKAGGGAVVRYVWDQGSVLAVEDDGGNQLERYARLGDRLLALEDGGAAGAERQQYFLLDGLSTPMAIVRGDGLVQARYRWDVWGRLRSGSGVSNNRFGLSGLERDEQSALIYARTRYLDPSLGRFLQPDPWSGALDRPLSLNPYLYAHGNPTIFVDPTGLCVFGLPCPEPLQIAKDTAIGVAGDVGGMAVGAVDFMSGGSVSGARDAYQAYQQSEGSLFERAMVAQEAGNRSRAAVLTLGYSEAESASEHTKELLGAASIERAGVLFGEAAVEGDWEKGLAGVGELLSGAGQIAGTVAGGAGTVSKVQAIRTARVAQQAQQATRARVLANLAESRTAREASRFKGHLERMETRVRVESAVDESAAARSASNARQRFESHVKVVKEALDGPGSAADGQSVGPAEIDGFRLAKHGEMPRPRPEMESHHGLMSRWMEEHFSGYDPNKAPAVLMPREAHNATRGTFNRWRAEMRRRMDGTFDWSKVPEAEMRTLGDKMFEAAATPQAIQEGYWRWFERMKAALERRAGGVGHGDG